MRQYEQKRREERERVRRRNALRRRQRERAYNTGLQRAPHSSALHFYLRQSVV